MREKTIENYLVTRIEEIGGMCVKFPPIFFTGFPDRLVFLPKGVFILVETKAPGKTPRLIQRKVHARLRAMGFRVEVLDTHEATDAFILAL